MLDPFNFLCVCQCDIHSVGVDSSIDRGIHSVAPSVDLEVPPVSEATADVVDCSSIGVSPEHDVHALIQESTAIDAVGSKRRKQTEHRF